MLKEKTLKQSMLYKKIDDIEAQELKKTYKHYLDKRKQSVRNTQFEVVRFLGDVISKVSISPEQITKLNSILAKIIWLIIFV